MERHPRDHRPDEDDGAELAARDGHDGGTRAQPTEAPARPEERRAGDEPAVDASPGIGEVKALREEG